jgi:hypothetical protein
MPFVGHLTFYVYVIFKNLSCASSLSGFHIQSMHRNQPPSHHVVPVLGTGKKFKFSIFFTLITPPHSLHTSSPRSITFPRFHNREFQLWICELCHFYNICIYIYICNPIYYVKCLYISRKIIYSTNHVHLFTYSPPPTKVVILIPVSSNSANRQRKTSASKKP